MISYLDFIQQPSSHKTFIYFVQNKTGAQLGNIMYYTQWRKYVFAPAFGIIFDANCLNEITSQLNKLNLERKVELQNRKLNNS
jgi:hypothetical protein